MCVLPKDEDAFLSLSLWLFFAKMCPHSNPRARPKLPKMGLELSGSDSAAAFRMVSIVTALWLWSTVLPPCEYTEGECGGMGDVPPALRYLREAAVRLLALP